MNFLCISLFFATYVFYCFLYGIVWVLNINKYNSDFNCNESKYCISELKMEFWHKKPFSICFVHKSRKFSNFEPTLDYIMLRNFGTVRPIFPKIAAIVAQDFKEKSHESSRREKKFHEIIARNVEGGGGRPPPPPGPFRVKQVREQICYNYCTEIIKWKNIDSNGHSKCFNVSWVFFGGGGGGWHRPSPLFEKFSDIITLVRDLCPRELL